MKLNPRLFWDTDINTIDYERHARHVIERVATRGTLEEWRSIVLHYGKDRVKAEAVRIRSLDPRTLHFLSAFFDLPISEFRCYTNELLNPAHSPY